MQRPTSTSSSDRPAYTWPMLDRRGRPKDLGSAAALLWPSPCSTARMYRRIDVRARTQRHQSGP